jgi:activator of HSP90 ATPase
MPIHQEITFKCAAQQAFDALTSGEQFGALTGAPTKIKAKEGGTFSCFGGMVTGMSIEMIPAHRLVQAWRVKDWDPGTYSIVKFELVENGDQTTQLIFDQSGFPAERQAHLEQGWYDNYWIPMKKYLEK